MGAREAVNRPLDWMMDTDTDSLGCVVRFGTFAAVFILVVAVVITALVWATTRGEPPSLFCPSGGEVHASPATEVVGKTTVEGVEYTC